MRHLIVLVLVACGAPEQAACPLPDPVPDAGPVDAGTSDPNPCLMPTGSVALTSAPVGTLPDVTALDCHGYDCATPRLSQALCPDGFFFTIQTTGSTVVIRLAATDRWTAGATIDGVDLVGSMTYSGLTDPFEHHPADGARHAAAFALHSATGTVSGALAADW